MARSKMAVTKNVINNDVVTPEIQESLLTAEHLGQAQMKAFVDQRLNVHPDGKQHLFLRAPIRKNNVKTFATLFEVVQPPKGKQTSVKV